MSRVFNFSAGPAVLPEEVLKEAQAELFDYKGCGMSIMEVSHRGKEYSAVHDEAMANLRTLMSLDDDHAILLLQGGASGQFAMLAMNLLNPGETADYIHTGSWASKAIKEAKLRGQVNIIANSSKESPARMPRQEELKPTSGAAYVHMTTNETIEGTQFKAMPKVEAPLVADMSSDILSRPLDFNSFGMIYAGAQKNLGPSGVTLVVIRKDLVEKVRDDIPIFFRYKTHLENDSLYNTPPCFSVYTLMLVTRWILKQGGLAGVDAANQAKAKALYDAIDATDFYRGTAHPDFRSDMNVTFRLPTEALEEKFLAEASARKLKGLKGHRSVGGMRASIYNAFPRAGVDALIEFMREFEKAEG